MFTISTTLVLALLGCALIARKLYLHHWMRARASHRLDGTPDDLWARQEAAAQEQAWHHLQQLERAASRKKRR